MQTSASHCCLQFRSHHPLFREWLNRQAIIRSYSIPYFPFFDNLPAWKKSEDPATSPFLSVLIFCSSAIRKELLSAVFFVELFNSAASFQKQFLAACVEGMAFGANFDSDFVLCGTCYKFIAAVTSYFYLFVFGMDTFAHFLSPHFSYLLINNLRYLKTTWAL